MNVINDYAISKSTRNREIVEHLESRFKRGTLYNSWLINANNTANALEDLQLFIRNALLGNDILLETHPDYKFVAKVSSTIVHVKNIAVEQIRDLQEFLSKTSTISGYKIAIIYQADLMNLNAANSCLKILEDTSKNSYIFLITAKAANMLSTIRSRCAKLNVRPQHHLVRTELYVKFITSIINYSNVDMKLAFIKEFSSKNRDLWLDFTDSVLHLMNRITKKSAGINIELTKLEYKILNKFCNPSPTYFIQKFIKIKHLINNTIDYDLDLRSSCVLLMNMLS